MLAHHRRPIDCQHRPVTLVLCRRSASRAGLWTLDRCGRCCFKHRPISLVLCLRFAHRTRLRCFVRRGRCTNQHRPRSRSYFVSESPAALDFAFSSMLPQTSADHARTSSSNRQPRWTLTLDRRGRCCFKHRSISLVLCLRFAHRTRLRCFVRRGRCTNQQRPRLRSYLVSELPAALAFGPMLFQTSVFDCQPSWTFRRVRSIR